MPKFNMPKWLTVVLAVVYLGVAWAIHRPDVIKPGAMINLGVIHLQLQVVLTDVLIGLAALGINGPQMLPVLAGILGNPPGPKPPAPRTS